MTRRRLNREVGQIGLVPGLATALPRSSSLSEYFSTFDAATEYARIDADVYDIERTAPFSITFWIRKTGGATAQCVGRRGNANPFRGFAVNVRGGGIIQLEVCNDNTTNKVDVRSTGFTVINGAWHLVVCTYDGSSTAAGCTIYGDGVNVTDPVPVQDNLSATIRESIARMAIMARYDTVNGPGAFLGEDLADVRYYAAELTAAQVTELWDGGRMVDNNRFSGRDDCEMWFRMGDNDTGRGYDSNTIEDNSDQGNDATTIAMVQANAALGAGAGTWPERQP